MFIPALGLALHRANCTIVPAFCTILTGGTQCLDFISPCFQASIAFHTLGIALALMHFANQMAVERQSWI
jgi:hypothetical protein